VGIDISELENAAALYSGSGSQQAEAAVGQAAKALLKEGGGGREEDGGFETGAGGGLGDRDGDAHPLWGQREDRQIQVSVREAGGPAWEGGITCCAGIAPSS
jgi:hypothetical protein